MSSPPRRVVDHDGRRLRQLCHLRATVRAAPALLRTPFHHVVIAHRFARDRACTADLSARRTGRAMKCRVTRHEIGARGADLRAIEQDGDVGGVRLRPPLLEAMPRRVQARLVAGGTAVNAGLHPFTMVVARSGRHCDLTLGLRMAPVHCDGVGTGGGDCAVTASRRRARMVPVRHADEGRTCTEGWRSRRRRDPGACAERLRRIRSLTVPVARPLHFSTST
jgi:hypothetical protein